MHIANMAIPLRFGIDLGEILSFPLFILHFITTLFVVKYFNMVNVEFRTFFSSNELLIFVHSVGLFVPYIFVFDCV